MNAGYNYIRRLTLYSKIIISGKISTSNVERNYTLAAPPEPKFILIS